MLTTTASRSGWSVSWPPGASLWMLVPGRLKAILAREVTRLDPAAAARAAEQARDERRVEFDAAALVHDRAGPAHHAPTRPARPGPTWTRPPAPPGTAGDRPHPGPAPRRHRHRLAHRRRLRHPHQPDRRHRPTRRPAAAGEPSEPTARATRRPTVCLPRPRGPLVHLTVAATTMLGLDREPAILHGPRRTDPDPRHGGPEIWPMPAAPAGGGCSTTPPPASPPTCPASYQPPSRDGRLRPRPRRAHHPPPHQLRHPPRARPRPRVRPRPDPTAAAPPTPPTWPAPATATTSSKPTACSG